MLTELAVRDLGIIAELRLVLGGGVTAVGGETGAGKTLIVQAIELLVGGRADPAIVRAGAEEAFVEGRFVVDGVETVVARVVPRSGRSRGYIDGRMAPVAALAATGTVLVDLPGQHAHQSLLSPAAQRAALDDYAKVDLASLRAARRRLTVAESVLAGLGGDERSRVRERDLLAFQVAELADARLDDPAEDDALSGEEDRLGDATAHREAAAAAHHLLTGEGGVADDLGGAIAAVAERRPLAPITSRLMAVAEEVNDLVAELRRASETLEDDPQRLAEIVRRRALLVELRRKFGATLEDVMTYEQEARRRLVELDNHDEQVAAAEAELRAAGTDLRAVEAEVGMKRRAAAPRLAAEVAVHLDRLAMPGARFQVTVGDEDPADDVCFVLGANAGESLGPLARVASGGELARTMLALRLTLRPAGGPQTLVFDEVDAGIGGSAALAVGLALADLAGDDRQVLVVTHLPQVAAFAHHQLAVTKVARDGRSVVKAALVTGDSRVAELSRMLSGHPESLAAREHAQELLAVAARARSC